MNCKEVRKKIHPYLDHELEPDQRARLQMHVDNCVSCRIQLNRMAETIQTVQSMQRLEAPAALRYMITSTAGYHAAPGRSNWFSTLQFRSLEIPSLERLRTTFLALPITILLFILATILVYSPEGMRNIDYLLAGSLNTPLQTNLVERQYLQNLYDFSPEVLTSNYVCDPDHKNITLENIYQPRISTVSVKMFVEKDFQKQKEDSVDVLASVHSDGSTEVESIVGGDSRVNKQIREMLDSAIVFPAIADGKLIDSKILLTFQKIEVKG